MALFDEKGRSLMMGFAFGVGAAALVRQFLPAVKEAAKPFTKATIKSGITAYEKARETVAQIGETVEDLVAEAIFEMKMEEIAKAAEPAAPTAPAGPKPQSNGGA
jgi:hypothetical protein